MTSRHKNAGKNTIQYLNEIARNVFKSLSYVPQYFPRYLLQNLESQGKLTRLIQFLNEN